MEVCLLGSKPGSQSLEVGELAEMILVTDLPDLRVRHHDLHQVEPLSDLLDNEQGLLEPLLQQPAAAGGPSLVQDG